MDEVAFITCDICGQLEQTDRVHISPDNVIFCDDCHDELERESFFDREYTEEEVEEEYRASLLGGASQSNEWLIIDPC